MTLRKINARDLVLEVETAVADTWVAIGGFRSATFNPSENEETADTTTYGSEGEYEQEVMQRGATAEVEGLLLKDDATGAQDTGQARVEVLGVQKGVESLGRIRFRHPVDTNWKIWTCTVSIGEQGGENNDKTSWGATFTKSGPSTTAAVV
ncbi:MAG: phage tail tube protein [Actinomycetota bacterium]